MQNRIVLTGTPDDGIRVRSIMYFPTDQDLRERWYTMRTLTDKLATMDNQAKIELTKENLDQIIDAPSFSELNDLTVIAAKKGVIAGDMLTCMYLMHRFDMPEPSMGKAVYFIERFAKEAKYGDSSPIPGSRRSIREAFDSYRTVAHFWAAYRLNRDYKFSEESEIFQGKLPRFLKVSQALREFGTTFIPIRTRPSTPVLSAKTTWFLPEGTHAHHLKRGEFPDRLKKYLDDYDAHKYRYKDRS